MTYKFKTLKEATIYRDGGSRSATLICDNDSYLTIYLKIHVHRTAKNEFGFEFDGYGELRVYLNNTDKEEYEIIRKSSDEEKALLNSLYDFNKQLSESNETCLVRFNELLIEIRNRKYNF